MWILFLVLPVIFLRSVVTYVYLQMPFIFLSGAFGCHDGCALETGRIGETGTGTASVFGPSGADAGYIVGGLITAHIAIAHNGIVVVAGLAQSENVLFHIGPSVR